MKNIKVSIYKNLIFFKSIVFFLAKKKVKKGFYQLKKQSTNNGEILNLSDIRIINNEASSETYFDTHYVYHPAWALRVIKSYNPMLHVDISSTLHFCTALSAFIPTAFYDFRPAFLNLSNLKSASADLCNLHFESNSIHSLSCMHTVEHIGLGRYGDPIDLNGDSKAINELQRVLSEGGNLLFVTPLGKPKIQYNTHRIYSYEKIISMFHQLELIEFSLIPDNALKEGIIINAPVEMVKEQNFSCGCFWFRKPVLDILSK